ncbi:MAG: hypothetical protein ACKD6N_06570 [Candidatus Bathyarchaeota archaeon]
MNSIPRKKLEKLMPNRLREKGLGVFGGYAERDISDVGTEFLEEKEQ